MTATGSEVANWGKIWRISGHLYIAEIAPSRVIQSRVTFGIGIVHAQRAAALEPGSSDVSKGGALYDEVSDFWQRKLGSVWVGYTCRSQRLTWDFQVGDYRSAYACGWLVSKV